MTNRRDLCVPVVAGKDRQQQGRQHRAFIRRVVAVVGQQAVRHPRIEYSAHLEELDEERQLSERCGRIPFDVDPAPERIECNRPVLSNHGLVCCLTHWVTPFVPRHAPLLRSHQGDTGAVRCFNCRV